jgi:hypothetical protein
MYVYLIAGSILQFCSKSTTMEMGDAPHPNPQHTGPQIQTEAHQLLAPSSGIRSRSPKMLFSYSATRPLRFRAPSQNDEPPTPGWASSDYDPKQLMKSNREFWWDFLVDWTMLMAGLPFLAIAGSAMGLNGKEVGTDQRKALREGILVVSYYHLFSIRLQVSWSIIL